MRITIICENSVCLSGQPGLAGEHGSAYLIEDDTAVTLYDTGQGMSLLNNMDILGKNIQSVDQVVISHGHYDHTGGLMDLLRKRDAEIPVYIHEDAFIRKVKVTGDGNRKEIVPIGMKYTRQEYEDAGARFVPVKRFYSINERMALLADVKRDHSWVSHDTRLKIWENETIKDDPFNDDLSVLLDSDKGSLLLLGCAHAGITNIIDDIISETGQKAIYAVIGGMHLAHCSWEHIEKVIETFRRYDVQMMAPCHCTGPDTVRMLANEFKEKFLTVGVGTVIEL